MNKVNRMIKLFETECKLSKIQSRLDRGLFSHLSDKEFYKKKESTENKLLKNYKCQEKLASEMTYEEKEILYGITGINLNEDEA